MVEFGQTPINESKFTIFVIDHNIVGLHVSMHNAHTVTIVEGFQQLVKVEANVVIGQCLVQQFEIGIVDVFKD